MFREPSAHDLAAVPDRPRALLLEAQARGVQVQTNGKVWRIRGPRADISVTSGNLLSLKERDLFAAIPHYADAPPCHG